MGYQIEMVSSNKPLSWIFWFVKFRECFCTWKELPKKGFPLIFHGIAGQDTREEKSPSFFNPEEVAKVVEYIGKLMEVKSPKLKETDIGIISPYRRQVSEMYASLKVS